MFAYCGNNPVDRLDPFGEEWYHWAIGAAIVTACAIATVATCSMSLAAAATAVGMVANGMAAATTASTVAAAAFVGSATVYGTAALSAASNSNSVDEFYAQGNWGTVAATAGGAFISAAGAYISSQNAASSVIDASFNLDGAKDGRYISKRGWNYDMINNAICNGKQGASVNMANGAACTVYCYPGIENQYVVIENVSRNVVQVSNFSDTGWIPDSRIVWNP